MSDMVIWYDKEMQWCGKGTPTNGQINMESTAENGV